MKSESGFPRRQPVIDARSLLIDPGIPLRLLDGSPHPSNGQNVELRWVVLFLWHMVEQEPGYVAHASGVWRQFSSKER